MSNLKWEALPDEVKSTMEWLGGFSPTEVQAKEIKGYMHDFEDGGVCKVYISAEELREMALHFNIVADYLEAMFDERIS